MNRVICEQLWKEVGDQLASDVREAKRELNLYRPTLTDQGVQLARQAIWEKKNLLARFLSARTEE